jgi:bifunctional UDP-N-acetylglucosamine pyrophosphorylase/glucosamine-1-phosphate N-acetyltransferase
VTKSVSEQSVAIVLAAGHGTRMKSALPKLLHPLLGRPMLSFPVQAALDAGAERVIAVLGQGRAPIEAMLAERFGARVDVAEQEEPRGTGDAARCGAERAALAQGTLLVLNGDAPLITRAPLAALFAERRRAGTLLAMLTVRSGNPTGYGRILRDAQGRVVGVVEQKDCSPEQARIGEWNPGVYAFDAAFFARAIARLTTANAQGELLLTDLVALAAKESTVSALPYPAEELHGVNDRAELAERERLMRLRHARELGRRGISVRDPESTFIDLDVTLEPDAVLEPHVHLRGCCVIESSARIDVGCVLTDVTVQAGAKLLPYTVAHRSVIGPSAQVGPFSHLRPGSKLGPEVHVGNFVETKNTELARGAKANHLSYLGDGRIGEHVNVGAGTIFCNYDGFSKHITVLEDGAFIGSDSQLVAPVTVGKGAYVATGTTVTLDVPDNALAIGRGKQENKAGMAERLRARLRARAERAKADRAQKK